LDDSDSDSVRRRATFQIVAGSAYFSMEPTSLAGHSRKLNLQDQLIAFQLIYFAIAALHQRGDKVGRATHLFLWRIGG
jgi:hypothetical protein